MSGVVNERLGGVILSTLSPTERLVFSVTGAASATLSTPQRDARVEAKMTYLFQPEIGVSVGGRAAWLEGSTLLGTNGFGWLAFVSVGVAVETGRQPSL